MIISAACLAIAFPWQPDYNQFQSITDKMRDMPDTLPRVLLSCLTLIVVMCMCLSLVSILAVLILI